MLNLTNTIGIRNNNTIQSSLTEFLIIILLGTRANFSNTTDHIMYAIAPVKEYIIKPKYIFCKMPPIYSEKHLVVISKILKYSPISCLLNNSLIIVMGEHIKLKNIHGANICEYTPASVHLSPKIVPNNSGATTIKSSVGNNPKRIN